MSDRVERRCQRIMKVLRDRQIHFKIGIAEDPGFILVEPDDNALHGLAMELQFVIYQET